MILWESLWCVESMLIIILIMKYVGRRAQNSYRTIVQHTHTTLRVHVRGIIAYTYV